MSLTHHNIQNDFVIPMAISLFQGQAAVRRKYNIQEPYVAIPVDVRYRFSVGSCGM